MGAAAGLVRECVCGKEEAVCGGFLEGWDLLWHQTSLSWSGATKRTRGREIQAKEWGRGVHWDCVLDDQGLFPRSRRGRSCAGKVALDIYPRDSGVADRKLLVVLGSQAALEGVCGCDQWGCGRVCDRPCCIPTSGKGYIILWLQCRCWLCAWFCPCACICPCCTCLRRLCLLPAAIIWKVTIGGSCSRLIVTFIGVSMPGLWCCCMLVGPAFIWWGGMRPNMWPL